MDSIRVKYEDGVFKPLKRTPKLKDGALGEVHVDDAHVATIRKRPSVRSSEFFGLCGSCASSSHFYSLNLESLYRFVFL